jgi:hypothetical protein
MQGLRKCEVLKITQSCPDSRFRKLNTSFIGAYDIESEIFENNE